MPARPLRPGEAPPKGTSILRGYVVAAGTGTPVRRAQVRAFSQDGRGGGVTSTDNEGRFEIKDLVASRYSLTVTKAGYVQSMYGQKRPNEPGTPIDLADGQIAEKLAFSLSRGGAIAGVIVDDGGEPVAGTQVQAMRFQFMAGQRRLVPGGGEGSSDRTDDKGAFRLYGLPPGEYFISGTNRSGAMMTTGPAMINTEADGFAPTYYPGTPNMAEAARIALKAGQEMTGANFALVVARMAKVSGRVLNSRGEPLGAQRMLMLTPADPMMGMNFGMNMSNAMMAADGAFTFTNVPPGRYNLNVRPMGSPGPTDEFAVMPVTVGNEDIENLIVSTSVGATIRGVVLTDDGTPPTFRPDQVQIFASPVDIGTNMIGGSPTRVNDDFSFEMSSLFERRLIRASAGGGGPMAGWYQKAVIFDGEDVTDRGIDFVAGRAYEGLQIVFTRKTTDLSGLVTDDRGRAVLDVSVIVFPANRDLWTPQTRYLRTMRPDTSGRYNTKGLPPLDDYLVIAVQNLESGQASDPEFLNRAREEAKPFTLTEGETKAVDVKVSRLVP